MALNLDPTEFLDLMKKGIHREDTVKANLKAKRCGIIPVFALMVGFPTETFDDINQTIDLLYSLKKIILKHNSRPLVRLRLYL